jgi:hypothetical protein
MENTINKPKKNRVAVHTKSKETKKSISKEDIRNRAYEIYHENITTNSNELDNWLFAERELSGYYN